MNFFIIGLAKSIKNSSLNNNAIIKYTIPDNITLIAHSIKFEVIIFFNNHTITIIAIQPVIGATNILPKLSILKFSSLFTKRIKKEIPSDIAVVNAAAFNPQVGINNKFKTKFKIADIMDVNKHTFSLPFGANIVLPIQPPKKEKNKDTVRICNDEEAPRYSLPPINKIISFARAFNPTIHGKPKNIMKFKSIYHFYLLILDHNFYMLQQFLATPRL